MKNTAKKHPNSTHGQPHLPVFFNRRILLLIGTLILVYYVIPKFQNYQHPPLHQVVLVDVSGSMFDRSEKLNEKEYDSVYLSMVCANQVLSGLREKDRWDLYYYVHNEAKQALSRDQRGDDIDLDLMKFYSEIQNDYIKKKKDLREGALQAYRSTDQAVPFEKAAELAKEDQGRGQRLRVLICCDGEQDWNDANLKQRVERAVKALSSQDSLEHIEVRGISLLNQHVISDWTKPLSRKSKISFSPSIAD